MNKLGVKLRDASAKKLDEVRITKPFDINEALSSIQFYWNLARQRGETIIVEIWQPSTKETVHETPPHQEAIEAQKAEV